MKKPKFAIVINPRRTNYFRNKKEFLYLTNKRCFPGLIEHKKFYSPDKKDAKEYTSMNRAIAAGKRSLGGWFMVVEL